MRVANFPNYVCLECGTDYEHVRNEIDHTIHFKHSEYSGGCSKNGTEFTKILTDFSVEV